MSTEEILLRLENMTIKEHKELIHFVRQYTKSADAAEDFIQEAYLEAMRNLNRIDQPERFISWLKTVAKRKAITIKIQKKIYYTYHSRKTTVICVRKPLHRKRTRKQ